VLYYTGEPGSFLLIPVVVVCRCVQMKTILPLFAAVGLGSATHLGMGKDTPGEEYHIDASGGGGSVEVNAKMLCLGGSGCPNEGGASACKNSGFDSEACEHALLSPTPTCPGYSCGSSTVAFVGPPALSMQGDVHFASNTAADYYFSAPVTVSGFAIEGKGPGAYGGVLGACTTIKGAMLDADGHQHDMGDSGPFSASEPIPGDASDPPQVGAIQTFTFPTPLSGTRFMWQCTSSDAADGSSFGVYTARPIFTLFTHAPTKAPTMAPPCVDTPASTAATASKITLERLDGTVDMELLEDGVLRFTDAKCLEATLCNTCGVGGGGGSLSAAARLDAVEAELLAIKLAMNTTLIGRLDAMEHRLDAIDIHPVTPAGTSLAGDIANSDISVKSSIKFSFEAKQGLMDLSGTHTLTYEDAAHPAVATTVGSTTALSFTQASAPGAPQCLDVRPAIPWVRLRLHLCTCTS
jgi:hypothetical protein